jgi:hypothetical protein
MGAVVSVNLDVTTPGITARRTVTLGESFVIDIWVEDDGQGITPVVFDTIILGVYFNDKGPGVLGVTRTHFPHAGELAKNSPTTVDAFSKRPIRANMEMALTPVESKLPENFSDTAGRAGLMDLENPFVINPGKPVQFAVGKLNAGFRSLAIGTSTVMASAPHSQAELFFKGEPIFAKTIPGVVTVVEERTSDPIQPFAPRKYKGEYAKYAAVAGKGK